MIWGVKCVNDSLIALSAIIVSISTGLTLLNVCQKLICCYDEQVRFLLSHDKEFVVIGKNSKIDYQRDFFTYRQLLNALEGQDFHTRLLAFYNERVFIGQLYASSASNLSAGGDAGGNAGSSADSYVNAVTNAMMAITLGDGGGSGAGSGMSSASTT